MTAENAPEPEEMKLEVKVLIGDDRYNDGYLERLVVEEQEVALGFFRKLASGVKEVAKSITRAERGPGGPLNYS